MNKVGGNLIITPKRQNDNFPIVDQRGKQLSKLLICMNAEHSVFMLFNSKELKRHKKGWTN